MERSRKRVRRFSDAVLFFAERISGSYDFVTALPLSRARRKRLAFELWGRCRCQAVRAAESLCLQGIYLSSFYCR